MKFSYMLIYAVICFDPRERFYGLDIYVYLLSHLTVRIAKQTCKGKMNEKEREAIIKSNNHPIQQLRYIFLCFCLNILWMVGHIYSFLLSYTV